MSRITAAQSKCRKNVPYTIRTHGLICTRPCAPRGGGERGPRKLYQWRNREGVVRVATFEHAPEHVLRDCTAQAEPGVQHREAVVDALPQRTRAMCAVDRLLGDRPPYEVECQVYCRSWPIFPRGRGARKRPHALV